MNGIDFSVWRPGAGWIVANGFGFVTRYLSWLPNRKVIDKAEFDAYRAAGIEVVLNWEWDVGDMLGGATNGRTFAAEARRQAELLGAWPCVIYFSCDTDAQPNQQPIVNDFLRAAGDVLGGPQLVGIYGGFGPVSRSMQAGVAAYGWQTYAWSAGQWHAPAQLRQTGGNADYGTDFSLAADFGQVGGKTGILMALTDAEQAEMLQAVRDLKVMAGWINTASDDADKELEWGSGKGGAISGWMPLQVQAIRAQVDKLAAVTGTDPKALAAALAPDVAQAVLALFRTQINK